MDGRYRVELVDAIAQWRDMHPDRMIRKIHPMDRSTTLRGANIYWGERDGGATAPRVVIGISDTACANYPNRKDVLDWLVAACKFAQDSDISLDSRGLLVSRHGIVATFSMCKSVVIAFPQSKLIHYLGPDKMVDLQLFLTGEFEDPTQQHALLRFPFQARF